MRSDGSLHGTVVWVDVNVSGTAEIEETGAEETIDRLAKKYLDADSYPFRNPAETRINVRVTPEQVIYAPGK